MLAYRVITDNPLDTPAEVRLGLPYRWGDALPGTGLICQGEDYDFQNKGPSQSVWHVTLDFSSFKIDEEEQERKDVPNPLDRRARVSVNSVRYSKLINKDIDGKAFITSAGESYPAQEVDDDRWTITVRKNYVVVPDFVYEYQKKLNASPITVKGRALAEKTVKFGEVRVPELQIENGVEHYPVEFTLDYKRDGWQISLLDAGFHYIKDGEVTEITVKDQDGNDVPTSVAVLLDGSGGLLHETLTHPVTATDTVFYNNYDVYETADFSILPLDES